MATRLAFALHPDWAPGVPGCCGCRPLGLEKRRFTWPQSGDAPDTAVHKLGHQPLNFRTGTSREV
jgi:hypothetical protein